MCFILKLILCKNIGFITGMKTYYKSPIGNILIEGDERGMSKLIFTDNADDEVVDRDEMASHWIQQLNEYFSHKREYFELEINLKGTAFQLRVWEELLKIPFGKTISYKDLSLRLGDLKAIRAVAGANGANPVSIIVPCHRVIGSDGSLTGYAGGLWRKRWLLDFESKELLFT
jgi:methylated-DNA-[protein]-cysteine S-methyltransferase